MKEKPILADEAALSLHPLKQLQTAVIDWTEPDAAQNPFAKPGAKCIHTVEIDPYRTLKLHDSYDSYRHGVQ
jgi:hypothetical protein